MSIKKALLTAAILATAAITLTYRAPKAAGDVFILADGGRIEGAVEDEGGRVLKVQTRYGLVTIKKNDIEERLEKSSPLDEYVEKKKEMKNTAGAHFEMGEWCKGKGFNAQAQVHWKETLKLDPGHKQASERLGLNKEKPKPKPKEKPVVKKEEKPAEKSKPEEKKKKNKVIVKGSKKKDKKKGRGRFPIPFQLTACCSWDADEEWLNAFGGHVKAGSRYLYDVTRGQMYISAVTITDKTERADIIVQNKDSVKIGNAYAKTGAGAMYVGGKMLAYTFAHEFLHLKCGIPDEYTSGGKPACPVCIMSADPRAHVLCDSKTHVGDPGKDCFSLLAKKFPGISENHDPAGKPCPETKVIVKNK
ncbi:MAG: hypothetical protein ACYS8W_03950 [Planctomycetota bacterium]|jgi:hypothetical protein